MFSKDPKNETATDTRPETPGNFLSNTLLTIAPVFTAQALPANVKTITSDPSKSHHLILSQDELESHSFGSKFRTESRHFSLQSDQAEMLRKGSQEMERLGVDIAASISPELSVFLDADNIIHKGDKAPGLDLLQEALNAFGVKPPLKITGIYDEDTISAIRNFPELLSDPKEPEVNLDKYLIDDIESLFAEDSYESSRIELLKSAHPEFRIFAADRLSFSENPTVKDLLAEIMTNDPDSTARYVATMALASLHDERSIPSLHALVTDQNNKIDQQILFEISYFKDSPLAASVIGDLLRKSCLGEVTSEYNDTSSILADYLKDLGKLGEEQFALMTQSEDPNIYRQGKIGLVRLGNENALPWALEIAQQEDPFKDQAITALANHLDNIKARGVFLEAFKKGEYASESGIRELGGKIAQALPILQDTITDKTSEENLIRILSGIREDAVPGLVSALKDKKLGDLAFKVLEKISDSRVVAAVCKTYSDPTLAVLQKNQLRHIMTSYISERPSQGTFVAVFQSTLEIPFIESALSNSPVIPSRNPGLLYGLKASLKEETRVDRIQYLESLIVDIERGQKIGIDYPLRFKPDVRKVLFQNLENPIADERPLAVLVFNKSDSNGAFGSQSNFVKDLIAHNYRVLYCEANSDVDAIKQLRKVSIDAGVGNAQKAQLIVWAGHGSFDAIEYGEGSNDASRLDLTDEDLMQFATECLYEGGQVLDISCSNGAGRDSKDNMGNLMRRVFPQAAKGGIFTSENDSYLSGWTFDNNNRIEYVDFNGKGTYYSNVILSNRPQSFVA